MADSFNVTAVLTARDNGFSSAFSKASGATDSLGSRLKNAIGLGAAMTIGMKAVGVATSSISSHLSSAIARYDQLNNFPKIMSNLGISTNEAEKASRRLSDGLQGLPTTLDSAQSAVTRFTSSNNDINKSTDYFLALNNAILAGGQSTEIQASALEQLSQSYAKGKMDMMEWRSLQQAMPAQLNQVAKAMGMTATELGEGLRDGSISMDDFMETIVKLNKEGVDGFASFEKQAKTATGGLKTAMAVLNTAITRGVASWIEAIDKALAKNNLPSIGETIKLVGDKVEGAFKKIAGALKKANLKGIIAGITPWVHALKGAFAVLVSILKPVITFINKHAEAFAKAAPAVLILLKAYAGFKAITGFIGPVKMFTNSISAMASKVTSALGANLMSTAAGETAAGNASKVSAKSVLAAAVAFVALGAGIALAAVGFALIAQSAIALSSAGGAAIAVAGGMIVVIAGLAAGAALLGPALTAASVGMIAFGAAVLMAGAGIKLATSGLAQLISAFPTLVTYGAAAAVSIMRISTSLLAFAAACVAGGIAGAALAVGLLAAATTGAVFLAAMTVASLGATIASAAFLLAAGSVALLAVGVKAVASSTRTIARNASAAAASLSKMRSSISVASAGIAALKAKASSTMSGVVSTFNSGVSKAISACRRLAQGVNSAASSKLRAAGKNAGQGFANGLRAKYNTVYSAAKSLASAAKKGATVTLKVHSPSKVFKEIGLNTGEGLALGLEKSKQLVASATSNMMAIPEAAIAGQGYFGGDYDYYRSNDYTIEVPVVVNGREIAKATAGYTQEELSKLTARANRREGRR